MKKHEIIFSTLKLPIDFCIVLLSFFMAKALREVTDLIPGIQLPIQTIDNESLFNFAMIGALLYVVLLTSHGLYSSKVTHSKIKEFLDIVRYGIYWFGFYSLFIYLWQWYLYSETEIPRLIILFSFIFTTSLNILSRIVLNNIQYFLMERDIIHKKNLILINNQKHSRIKDIIADIKKAKIYNILWYINKTDLDDKKLHYLGKQKKLLTLCEQAKVDEILFIDSDFSKNALYKIWDISRIFWVRYRYMTHSFDITQTNTHLSLIHNLPVLEIKSTSLWMWWRVVKRSFDLVASSVLLIILSPLLLVVAIIIKITDPDGPIIYKNTRIGQDGIAFTLYKFRYMKWEYCTKESYGIGASQDKAIALEKKLIAGKSNRLGPLYKIKNDPRKTKFGKYIEKYSIDELPQLYNVIRWNMSLVWPRPHQPREVEKYSLYQKRLLTIKPGMSGMAQVNGREKNSFDEETKLDIFYIENWSILLDSKILLKTLPIIFNKK